MITVLQYFPEFNRGGVQRVVLELCKHISDEFKVIVVASKGGGIEDEYKAVAKQRKNVRVVNLSRPGGFDVRSVLQVNRLIRENRVDVVHAHVQKGHVYGLFWKLLNPSVKLVITRHNTSPEMNRLAFKVSNWIVSWVCARIIAVSKSVKRQLVEKQWISGKKIGVVYNGINIEAIKKAKAGRRRSQLGFKKDDIVVGFVGTLSEQKAPDVVVESFARAKKEVPNLKLLMGGKGPEKGLVEELVREKGLTDDVRLLGQRDDVYNLYEVMDVFLLPSRWEGFGLVVAEALVKQVPVIVSEVDGITEIVQGRYGAYVRPDDVVGIAEQLVHVVNNLGTFKKKAKQGGAFVEKTFSVERMVEGYERIYKN